MDRVRQFFTFVKDRINEGELGGLFTDSDDSDDERQPLTVPRAISNTVTFLTQRITEGELGGLFTESENSDSDHELENTDEEEIQDQKEEPELHSLNIDFFDITTDGEAGLESPKNEDEIQFDKESKSCFDERSHSVSHESKSIKKHAKEDDRISNEGYDNNSFDLPACANEDEDCCDDCSLVPGKQVTDGSIHDDSDVSKSSKDECDEDGNTSTKIFDDETEVVSEQSVEKKDTKSIYSSEMYITCSMSSGSEGDDEDDFSETDSSDSCQGHSILYSRTHPSSLSNDTDGMGEQSYRNPIKSSRNSQIYSKTQGKTPADGEDSPKRKYSIKGFTEVHENSDEHELHSLNIDSFDITTDGEAILEFPKIEDEIQFGKESKSCFDERSHSVFHESKSIKKHAKDDDRISNEGYDNNFTDLPACAYEDEDCFDDCSLVPRKQTTDDSIHDDSDVSTSSKDDCDKDYNTSTKTFDVETEAVSTRNGIEQIIEKEDTNYNHLNKLESNGEVVKRHTSTKSIFSSEMFKTSSMSSDSEGDDEDDFSETDSSSSDSCEGHPILYSRTKPSSLSDDTDGMGEQSYRNPIKSSRNSQIYSQTSAKIPADGKESPKRKCSITDFTEVHEDSDEQSGVDSSSEDGSSENEKYDPLSILESSDSDNENHGYDLANFELDSDEKSWYDSELERRMQKVVDKRKISNISGTDDKEEFYMQFQDDDIVSRGKEQDFILKEILEKGLDLDENFKIGCKRLDRSKSNQDYSNTESLKGTDDSIFEGVAYIEDENNIRVECKPDEEIIHISSCSKTLHCFSGDTVLVRLIGTRKKRKCGEIIKIIESCRYHNVEHPVLLCTVRMFSQAMVPLCKSVSKIHSLNKRKHSTTCHCSYSHVDIYRYDSTTRQLKFNETEKLNPNNRKRKVFVVVIIGWNDDEPQPLGAVIDCIDVQDIGTCLKLCKLMHNIPNYNDDFESENLPGIAIPDDALEIFTIDAKGTVLKDDGFSLQETNIDNDKILHQYRLGIHVTNVACVIPKDSDADNKAEERIVSLKQGNFPTLHLLPMRLCLDCCSLNERKKRNVISLFLNVSEMRDGTWKVERDDKLCNSVVMSVKEYCYEDVDYILQSTKLIDYEESSRLGVLQKVAEELRNKRLERQIMKLSSHEIVEEFMINANHWIAEFILKHEKTRSKICRRSLRLLNQIGIFNESDREISTLSDNEFSTGSVDRSKRVNISLIKQALGKHIGAPPSIDISFSKEYDCDSNMKSHAEYIVATRKHTRETLHLDLRLNPYTHFTSPMRRYVDILTQRIVSSIIDKSCFPYSNHELEAICQHVNKRQHNLMKYENKAIDLSFSNELLIKSEMCLAEVVSFDEMSVITLNVRSMVDNGTDTVFQIPFIDLDLSIEPQKCKLGKYSETSACIIQWKKRIYCTYAAEKVTKSFPVFLRKDNKSFDIVPFKHVALLPASLASKLNCNETNLSTDTKIKLIDQVKARKTSDIPDIRSDEEKGLIFMHFASVSFELFVGQRIDVVLSTDLQRGTMRPIPSLISFTPNFQICVRHTNEPIHYLTSYATEGRKETYQHTEQYTHIWGKIIDMEATYNAVKEMDNPIICGIDIEFKGRQGIFTLTEEFCVLRDIDITGAGHAKIGSHFEEVQSKSYLCIRCQVSDERTHECYVWIGHAWIQRVKKAHIRDSHGKIRAVYLICFTLHPETSVISEEVMENERKVRGARIELLMKSVVDSRTECCIRNLSKENDLATSIALGRPPAPLDIAHLKACNKICDGLSHGVVLNNQQTQAIKQALRAPFSLIQGPPGTGKTFTGIELIKRFYQLNQLLDESVRPKIIYCGPSNKSVDLVARWFLAQQECHSDSPAPIRIVRMYGKAHETNDYPVPGKAESPGKRGQRNMECDNFLKDQGVVLHHIIRKPGKPYSKELRDFERKFRGPLDDISVDDVIQYEKLVRFATKMELKSYDVIFCTLTMAVAPNLHSAIEGAVRQIIIDEAGMCTEPLSMAPIITHKPKQVVLIGDHQQLRPIVKSREAKDYGLVISLFERHAKLAKQPLTLLMEQYRMNEHICEFPSQNFYRGELKTRREEPVEYMHSMPAIWENPLKPIVFFDVRGEELSLTIKTAKGNERSKSNRKEIDKVVAVFKKLLNHNISSKDINVMSQYNAQCKELKAILSNTCKKDLNVNTVVSSQGGEWDYVIFSTVRSLPSFLIEDNPPATWFGINLGFITDSHQVNVALTRAKKGLIIIGNMKLLQTHHLWRKLLNHLRENECIVSPDVRYPRKDLIYQSRK